MTEQSATDQIAQMGHAAREAARQLAEASPEAKSRALMAAADALLAREAEIMDANAKDLDYARDKGLSAAMIDRLRLDPERIAGIAEGLRSIAQQPDPVGRILAEWERPNGLRIQRVATPIGVIGVIYESRPNVTADAGALALKSGNAVILRGGSDSLNSSAAIQECMAAGLRAADLPEAAIQLVASRDRALVGAMLGAQGLIDVIVPRGGKGLVGRVQAEARVPVFAHLEGICHIYIGADADPQMARDIVVNAKTRRTGVCGAAECVLIDQGFGDAEGLIAALIAAGVEVRGDGVLAGIAGVTPAGPEDFGREFLDMIIAARPVAGVEAAIAHIRRYGSGHTESVVTADEAVAARFMAGIDSAIVMHNASTQFADGGEFGMGAEIGIATGKLHARGPVGAEQLCSFKYLVRGQGTLRP